MNGAEKIGLANAVQGRDDLPYLTRALENVQPAPNPKIEWNVDGPDGRRVVERAEGQSHGGLTPCPVCSDPDCPHWALRQNETWHPVTVTRQTRPEDLPRGFAETGMPGIVEFAAEAGSKPHQDIVAETRRNGFPKLLFDIPDGRIYDAGIDGYGEFFCSLNTAAELLARDVTTLTGRPGRVSVVYRYLNGAQMKWRPL